MACCGRGVPLSISAPSSRFAAPVASGTVPAGRPFVVGFEYTGRTGLTVVGPVSGQRYRFDRPGARVEVDGRDRRGLAGVPHLREHR
jgi:hypothetical protein